MYENILEWSAAWFLSSELDYFVLNEYSNTENREESFILCLKIYKLKSFNFRKLKIKKFEVLKIRISENLKF